MSKVNLSRGVVVATAAAAIFSAGCSNQQDSVEKEAATGAAEQGMGNMEGMGGMEAMKSRMGEMKSQARQSMEPATEVKVACFGINACKGQSECATPENACKGMNSCKGKGYLYVSLKECEAQGGKVITPRM